MEMKTKNWWRRRYDIEEEEEEEEEIKQDEAHEPECRHVCWETKM